jgi:hypothetical protein
MNLPLLKNDISTFELALKYDLYYLTTNLSFPNILLFVFNFNPVSTW